jgi:adenosylhomocysteine nucleosidase
MGQICILCAIRQETAPVLKRFPSRSAAYCAGLPAWRFQAYGHTVTLVQSGTGVKKAATAVAAAATLAPEIIISAGFCGALTAEVPVGTVFLAEKLYPLSQGVMNTAQFPDQELYTALGSCLQKAVFITTTEIVGKADAYALLPEPEALAVLEMEGAAVAAACRERSIRFIAVRSVSDASDQDPGRLFQQICDEEFNVRTAKIAASLLKKPALLAEYVKLYRNSAIAGKTLSEALTCTLERI